MVYKLCLGIILFVFLGLGLYRLEALPGEWFGDILNLQDYVTDIQRGKWPIEYRCGVGPLYHYLITPLASITPQRYVDYKVITVIVGLFSLISIMMLAKELFDKKTVLLTGSVTAVSFMFISLSRHGNIQILMPGVVALMLMFVYRWKKTQNPWYVILGAFFASWGPFIYLPVTILPGVYFLTFLALSLPPFTVLRSRLHTRTLINFRQIRFKKIIQSKWVQACINVLGVFVIAGMLFAQVVNADPTIFFDSQGYFGEKLNSVHSLTVPELMMRFMQYVGKTAAMYIIPEYGDPIFRTNVPKTPFLDPLSGFFLLIGLLSLFRTHGKGRRFLLVPLMLIPLPAMFPTLHPDQVPSSTRTAGLMALIYLFVGVGIERVYSWLPKKIRMAVIILCIGIIAVVNVHKYFFVFPYTLPNHNEAYGKLLAEYVDTLPSTTIVYMADWGWGEWAEPESHSIYYQLRHRDGRESLKLSHFVQSCEQIDTTKDGVIILRPDSLEQKERFMACSDTANEHMIKDRYQKDVARIVRISGKR